MFTLIFRLLPLLAFLMFIGALAQPLMTSSAPSSSSQQQMIPEFSLPNVNGNGALTSASLKGQPYLLNVFATWCVPCAAELPLLQMLAKKHHLRIIGIAWHDAPDKIRPWLKKHRDVFESVALDREGTLTKPLGISGVPESFLVNAQGEIIWQLSAPLTEEIIQRELLPAWKKLP